MWIGADSLILIPVRLNSRSVAITFHVLVWSAVLFVPYFFASPSSHYATIGSVPCNYFTLTNVLHIGVFYFNAFFLYSRFLNRRHWWLYLLTLALLVIVVYHLKVFILTRWFPALATEEHAFAFTFFPIVFFVVVSTVFRLVSDKINLEKEQLAMELKFLRSQVNPHFLFNVLNNLVSMARHQSEQLEPSLIKLSGLMRYMLFDSGERKISLRAEVEYLRSYIDLQELRFGEDVEIETNMGPLDATHTLEPMLLIPFVENAFKHGITSTEKPVIRVDLKADDGTLHFRVTNRVEKDRQSKDGGSGIGLANVRARLNLLYPGKHRLKVGDTDGVFVVDLTIKLF
jgi:two-component system LytT family sensor kinase